MKRWGLLAGRDDRHRGKAAIVCMLMGTSLMIAGCDSLGNPFGALLPVSQSPIPPSSQPVNDPIAEAVSRAPLNQSFSMTDPRTHARMTLRVISTYRAASGYECREYLISSESEAPLARVACAEEKGWVRVAPLIAGGAEPPTIPTP
jgi:hypothetical protein